MFLFRFFNAVSDLQGGGWRTAPVRCPLLDRKIQHTGSYWNIGDTDLSETYWNIGNTDISETALLDEQL